jgi:CheY-like chemotaxis protein
MGRVLLVEDHDGVHRVLCNLIEETGHEAECVKTKREALARLAPASHHLVIADVRLPDGLGHAVAERAAELGIKTVLMTGTPMSCTASVLMTSCTWRSHSAWLIFTTSSGGISAVSLADL